MDEYCTVISIKRPHTDALLVNCGHTHPLPLSLGKEVAYHAEGVGAGVMWEWDVDDIARHTLLPSMACARVVPLTCHEDTDMSRQSQDTEREVSSAYMYSFEFTDTMYIDTDIDIDIDIMI